MPNGDPTLRRGEAYVAPDGLAALIVDDRIYRFEIEADLEAQPMPRLTGAGGQVAPGGTTGGIRRRWTPVNSIATQLTVDAIDQSLWGVFDGRSLPGYGTPDNWAVLEGAYADLSDSSVSIDAQGAISGSLHGCLASGIPTPSDDAARGLLIAELSLSSCAAAGAYTIFLVASEGRDVTLLIVGDRHAWQTTLR
ncbi:hypothetical protein [Hyphobacterium sp.]|uniref:hypothetical protein n=1 Tax=Hyphobacterium sp. TaxID=2004662 RepID=UPI003BAAFD3A